MAKIAGSFRSEDDRDSVTAMHVCGRDLCGWPGWAGQATAGSTNGQVADNGSRGTADIEHVTLVLW